MTFETVGRETSNKRLFEELHAVIGPVARLLDVGVIVSSRNDITSAMILNPASSISRPGFMCLHSREKKMTSAASLQIGPGADSSDHLFLFFDEGQEHVTGIMRHLIDLALSNLRLRSEEESLLEELSSSWESLEAVYEISSDLRAVKTPADLLERIMNRAVAIGDGMSAALWIQDGEDLIPYALANVDSLANKNSVRGLVAKAVTARRAIVFNDAELLAAEGCFDSELEGATSLAVAPIATGQGLLGALEVWSAGGNKCFDSHTVNLIQALALQAAMVIENDRLHKATIEAERLQQEIEIGSKIQQVLLLGQLPEPVPGLSLAAYTLASRQIDGDFYEFFRHRDDCIDIIIGDVMGKGIPAALVGAATKSHLYQALNRLLASSNGSIPEPEQIINAAHTRVTTQLIDCESFTTLCLARFDITNRHLTFVDCGHTQTIRYRNSGEIEFLQGVNMPLGFSEKEVYEQTTISFDPGDVFLFYSDGLTEAHDHSGELFGEERLADCVRAHGHLQPAQLIEKVRAGVVAFAASEIFSDDLTCVAVKIDDHLNVLSGNRAELVTTSNLLELEKIRSFVREVCDCKIEPRLDPAVTDSLVLGLNEAATNIMRHAYAGRDDGEIRFVAEVSTDAIVIRICHYGAGFDRANVVQPEFDRTREGGFGLFIIEQCFDDVAYTTDEQGKHCTRLIKTINTKE
ncbi:MAG TPA: SpoIIE family protein phosphatase [Pyrinomonadaceae bacterium]|nr:SpoIIE family protein phosphatase [Pyrinomonadaceae bacterium]